MVVVVARDHRTPSVLVKPTQAADPATTKALDDLRRAVNVRVGLMDQAILLEDVALVTADWARVAHNLGRRPRGYIVVRTKAAPGAAYSVYDDNDNQTDSQRFLYLRSIGANVTVDLAVF